MVMWMRLGQETPRIARHHARSLLQDHSGEQRVTNIELFFDLVYVFAVTQMSHHLLAEPTVEGALQTALLLALVWWAWVYTTWATNYLDARRLPGAVPGRARAVQAGAVGRDLLKPAGRDRRAAAPADRGPARHRADPGPAGADRSGRE
jgi:Bacterial low temperature requirement A protein (LtrA)